LQDAGADWDAVRVPRQLGLAAMAILGARCGAVLEYPHKEVVFFFVQCDTAAGLAIEGTQPLGKGSTLTIPPARRTESPGPRWRVCPGDSDWLTDTRALQAALEDCLPSVNGSGRTGASR
jgi:hypothetical protein